MKSNLDVPPVLDQPIIALADSIRGSTAPSASVLRAVVATLGQEVALKNHLARRGLPGGWANDPEPSDAGGRNLGDALDDPIAELIDAISDIIVSSADIRGQGDLIRAVDSALVEGIKSKDRHAGAVRRCHGGSGPPSHVTAMINQVRIDSLRNLLEVVRDRRDEPLTLQFFVDGSPVLVLCLQEQRPATVGILERGDIPHHVPVTG